jgi:hypothetical protein
LESSGPRASPGFICQSPGETAFNIGSEEALFDNVIFCGEENHWSVTQKIEVGVCVTAGVLVIVGVGVTCWWRRVRKAEGKLAGEYKVMEIEE